MSDAPVTTGAGGAPAPSTTDTGGGSAPAQPAGVPDWTRGGRGLALQHCAGCSHLWYFRRAFCPACGRAGPTDLAATGTGTVQAATVVHRAPDDVFRAFAPYGLVLVALDEGPRVMGHAATDIAIGDRVAVGWRAVGDRVIPCFQRVEP